MPRSLTLLCLMMAVTTASGQDSLESAMGVRGWALIIGVSRYVHAEPLRYAASDAQAFSRFLLSPRGGGLPEERVITLLEEDANRFRILAELERLQDEVGPDDMVFVFLAGHGYVTRRGIGYFIPSDGDVNLPAPTSIPFSSLKELVEIGLARVKHRVLVTDLCHSGRIGPERSELASRIQNLINEELLRIAPGTRNFLNLLGSRPTEPSWERDDLGGGVFSHVLLEGLNGRAIEAGTEVRAKPLVDYVQQEVPRHTANQQHPMVNQDFDPELTLANLELPGPGAIAEEPSVRLVLTGVTASGIRRIEWNDPVTGARSLKSLEAADTPQVTLSGLAAGIVVFELFDQADSAEPAARIELELSPGEVRLELDRIDRPSASRGRPRNTALRAGQPRHFRPRPPRPGTPALVPASVMAPVLKSVAFGPAVLPWRGYAPVLAAQALPQPTLPQVAIDDATLMLRPEPGTRIYVDGALAGVTPEVGLVQLPGLSPGSHRVYLVPAPDREYRFRVELTPGVQFLDWQTGQLQPRRHVPPPPDRRPPPPGLDQELLESYRRLQTAVWDGELVGPADSAVAIFQRLSGRLEPVLENALRRELAAACGERAQRIILRYLAGGDVRWTPEVFEEGADLIGAFRSLVASAPFLESQEHFFRGRARLERGQFPEAVEALQRAVALDPEASHALNALGLVLWRQNRLREAVIPLEAAIELSPAWTYPRNTLAMVRLELREYENSEALLRGSLEIQPRDSVAWHGLGQLHLLFGEFEEAERTLQESVAANPGNAYTHHTFGLLLQRTLRLEEAEEMLRLAIRLEPEEQSFRISLAGLLRQAARLEESDRVLQELLRAEPESAQLHMAFAEHLAASGRKSAALEAATQALRLAADGPLLVRAGLLWMDDNPGRARNLFRRAAEMAPQWPFAHYNLAVLAAARGELRVAQQELDRALAIDPRYAAAYLLLGKLREAEGRLDKAVESFDRARQLAVEPALQREVEVRLAAVRERLTAKDLEDIRARLQQGDGDGAWEKLVSLWTGRTARLELRDLSPGLRNLVLEVAFHFPETADPGRLPAGGLRDALQSEFWASAVRAEQFWRQGMPDEGVRVFTLALEQWPAGTPLHQTSFGLNNLELSPHGLVLRWMARELDAGRAEMALRLYRRAEECGLFGAVPGLEPISIDRLLVPDDEPHPQEFSDFEVALHPDVQLHRLLVQASVLASGFADAARYLEALEHSGPDLAARLSAAQAAVRSGRSREAMDLLGPISTEARAAQPLLDDVLWLQAKLELEAGEDGRAVRTLNLARKLYPKDNRFRQLLREAGRQR